MIKKLFTALVAVLICSSANSQERYSGDIEMTPYLAYTQSFFNGDNANFYEAKSGISFGIKGDYYFNDRWSLRTGLNYDSMGSGIVGSNNDVNLDYINIPLNANWHFGSTRKWNLNFGVTPGFLIKAEQDGFGEIKDQVKSFQFGVSYGIGYKLEVSDTFSIMFDAQGLVGLSDINDIQGGSIKQMNAGSSFGIGGVFVL